jgi:hypothetical protein
MLLCHDSASNQRCKSLVDNKMVALAKELKILHQQMWTFVISITCGVSMLLLL